MMNFLKKIGTHNEILLRFASTNVKPNVPFFCYNRNPRNLEKLRIENKPIGWHLEKPGREYWNKIVLKTNRSSRSVTGEVVHNSGTIVVTASTNEWAIAKQLYSKNDMAAYVNLARVLAQRCLESGISEVACFIERKPETKVEAFLQQLEKEGVTLGEPPEYENPRPSDLLRPEKPWEVY